MADSADTTAERTRAVGILGKIITNPTRANIAKAFKAIRDGKAVVDFTPPDACPASSNG